MLNSAEWSDCYGKTYQKLTYKPRDGGKGEVPNEVNPEKDNKV